MHEAWIAKDTELHAGIIGFRVAGLTSAEQWKHLSSVIDHVIEHGLDLTNTLVEVWGPEEFVLSDLCRL